MTDDTMVLRTRLIDVLITDKSPLLTMGSIPALGAGAGVGVHQGRARAVVAARGILNIKHIKDP